MAEVIFKTPEGDEKVDLKPGERLLKGAYTLEMDVRYGFGDCGGNCVCCTCHVYVEEGAEGFEEPTAEEEDMLDTAFNLEDNSRLACQLKVSPEAEKIVVRLPES